ncbi:hypothetical protein [Hydrogenovibrio kuenenii]|nr:hypothetical protein [Hydrogenovibrio kuenenii]
MLEALKQAGALQADLMVI